MTGSWLMLLGGLCCAGVGGELFLRGAVGMARWLRVPAGSVGATVAAFATSSAELRVAVRSGLAGAPEFSLGDALGSNVMNVGLILGLALVLRPLQVHSAAIRRDFPVALAAPLVTVVLAYDSVLSQLDGAVMWLGFTQTPPPREDEMRTLAETIHRRLPGLTKRRGMQGKETISNEEQQLDALAACGQLALTVGKRERSGPALAIVGEDEVERPRGGSAANVNGINVYAFSPVDGADRETLERLCRYMPRGPLALHRLKQRPDGMLSYRLKKPDRRGNTVLVLSPHELLARLCSLIPAPRHPTRRYFGILGGGAKDRKRVVPKTTRRKRGHTHPEQPTHRNSIIGHSYAFTPPHQRAGHAFAWGPGVRVHSAPRDPTTPPTGQFSFPTRKGECMMPTGPDPDQTMSMQNPSGFVRTRRPEDIPAIRALMARAYPHPHGPEAVWSEATLLAHLSVFPEGQLVALTKMDGWVGSATSMRIASEIALAPHTWSEITARGRLTNHDPTGDALYGVNIVVDPAFHGLGYARLLYDARIRLAKQLGCKRIVAGARIPGYHKVADQMTPEDYVNAVTRGDLFDPTLSKQLKVGFTVQGTLRAYSPDPETLGHAALIVLQLESYHAL